MKIATLKLSKNSSKSSPAAKENFINHKIIPGVMDQSQG
jgi:hypothetical protein